MIMSMDYISKVGEKQFSDVRKGRKSKESKIEVHYSWLLNDNPLPHCLFTVHVFSLITLEKFQGKRLLDLKRGSSI